MCLTDQEVFAEINSNSLRNRIRKLMRVSAAKIDKALHDNSVLPPKFHRIELEEADKLIRMVIEAEEYQGLFVKEDKRGA